MSDFMKQPCKHCPYRNDVKPYLTYERAEELAYAPQNPYNTFVCHKTTEYDDERDDMVVTGSSKECAGFLTLRAQAGEDVPKGFEPAFDICYVDDWDMLQAYSETLNKDLA